jgi:hypothetical protein
VEEIPPPSISNKPGVHKKDATVASPEPLRLIEESIQHYHTLSLAPAIPANPLNEPPLPSQIRDALSLIPYQPEPPLLTQNQDALSLIPYQQNITAASVHPSELPHLLLHEPLRPLLAVPALEDEDMQPSWDFKKDRGRAAEVANALNEIVKARHRKRETTNLWVQSRISGMLALCCLFSSLHSRLSWTQASEVAAEAVGHGNPTYARKLRRWVIEFERQGMDYTSLPLTQHGRFDTRRLFDEDLSTKIHDFLLKLRKDQPFFKAEDIVNFIATPDMQLAMDTKATTISKTTAQRWLTRMGWRYGEMPNGMYIDGHERKDVVEYRTWFLAKYKRLERRMRRYDGEGNIEKLPELKVGERVIREVTHDSGFTASLR